MTWSLISLNSGFAYLWGLYHNEILVYWIPITYDTVVDTKFEPRKKNDSPKNGRLR